MAHHAINPEFLKLLREKVDQAKARESAAFVSTSQEAGAAMGEQLKAHLDRKGTAAAGFSIALEVYRQVWLPQRQAEVASWPRTVWAIVSGATGWHGFPDLTARELNDLVDTYSWSVSLQGLELHVDADLQRLIASLKRLLNGYGIAEETDRPEHLRQVQICASTSTIALQATARRARKSVDLAIREFCLQPGQESADSQAEHTEEVRFQFPNPPSRKDDWFYVMEDIVSQYQQEYGRSPSSQEAWSYLHAHGLKKYDVRATKDRGESAVCMSDETLGRRAFIQRFDRYMEQ